MAAPLEVLVFCFGTDYYDVSTHAYHEMDADELSMEMIEQAIGDDEPEVIEDYPTDPRGASCIILAYIRTDVEGADLPVHVNVGYKDAPARRPRIITAYAPPDPDVWLPDLRTRRNA